MHIIIGLATLAILYYINLTYKWIEIPTDTNILLQLLIVGIIYSNMPDGDQPGSITNKWLTVALIGVIIYSFYNPIHSTYGVIAAVIIVLLRLIEHRKCIHSIVGGLIISAPLLYFSTLHFIVGFIAFMSHIISDGELSLFLEKDWKVFKRK